VLILPVGHESQVARRWPWVTCALIAVNVVVFLATHWWDSEQFSRAETKAREAIQHYRAHPGLELPPKLKSRVGAVRAPEPNPYERVAEEIARFSGRRQVSDEDIAARQKELDALVDEMERELAQAPTFRFGYIPAHQWSLGLVTSQFMHGGWLHLIGNMWFLWLVGCNVEDRWGRLLFPFFYLAAGAAAALTHGFQAKDSLVPLIGASGAVAGAMGAFLARFAKTEIRFFWFYFLMLQPRWGTFGAPAYVMLPLWAAVQLLWGLLMPAELGGVAYAAHVGGFVFGLARGRARNCPERVRARRRPSR
jgi:membrane associated rhomboid family serine protease